MTKQEEIREGMVQIVGDKLHDHAYYRRWDDNASHDLISKEKPIVDAVLRYLHSQGVVIKVERELPNGYAFIKTLHHGGWKSVNPENIGYEAVEPLIKEE